MLDARYLSPVFSLIASPRETSKARPQSGRYSGQKGDLRVSPDADLRPSAPAWTTLLITLMLAFGWSYRAAHAAGVKFQ